VSRKAAKPKPRAKAEVPPGEITATGPGKVILLGEHAVVYGQPALAGALSWGVTARAVPARRCELVVPRDLPAPGRKLLERAFHRAAAAAGAPKVKVQLEGELPVSMGLGSSAAVGVACARVLLRAAGRRDDPRSVVRIALLMESEFHGTPSGVDHTTSATGELIAYRRRDGAELGSARVVRSPHPLKVLVALVGRRSGTREMVSALRHRIDRWPVRYGRLLEEIGTLASEGARAVEEGDLEALGDAMNVNQGLLCAMQLSSPAIEEMVQRLRHLGALGAKLTGAGGAGGAVVALFLEPEPLVARLRRAGLACFSSQLAGPAAL